jgi:hypothetical protein
MRLDIIEITKQKGQFNEDFLMSYHLGDLLSVYM